MKFSADVEANHENRDPLAATDALFSRRWSPRSLRNTEIPQEILDSLFDAARWAPSCHNEQPWVFLTPGDGEFDLFLSLLNEGNQSWAKNAALIGFICARKHFARNGGENRHALFDCGAAWMSLALQASLHGLYAHGMAGIKRGQVHEKLGVPEGKFEVACGFAVGALDQPGKLPADLAAREKPSPRKPLAAVHLRGNARAALAK